MSEKMIVWINSPIEESCGVGYRKIKEFVCKKVTK